MNRLSVTLFFFLLSAGLQADEPLRYVAPGAKVFFGVEVGKVLSSPFGKLLFSAFSERERSRIDEFSSTSGFDPVRDLTRILISSPETKGEKNSRGLVVLEGNFDTGQILMEAAGAGRQMVDYAGVPMITGGGTGGWMALPASGLVLLGDEATLKAVLGRKPAGGASEHAQVLPQLERLSGEFDLWLYSNAPISEIGSNGGPMGGALNGEAFQGVEQTIGGVRFGELIEIEGHMTAQSDKDAQDMVNVVRFFSSLMAMQTADPNAPPVGSWLQSMQIRSEGRVVSIGMAIPQKDFESVLQMGREQFKARQSRTEGVEPAQASPSRRSSSAGKRSPTTQSPKKPATKQAGPAPKPAPAVK